MVEQASHTFKTLILSLLIIGVGASSWADSDSEKEYQAFKDGPLPIELGSRGFVEVDELKPTQIFLGFIEVESKADELEKLENNHKKEFHKYLLDNTVKVVLGPGNRYYIVDHHHLAASLSRNGKKRVFVEVIGDLSTLSPAQFWKIMADKHWVYPYSRAGRLISNPATFVTELPANIHGMIDDPYRSLAWAVKEKGGFDKDETDYYIEFVWANFFRDRIVLDGTEEGFERAVRQALKLVAHNKGLAAYIKHNCPVLLRTRHINF